MKKPSSRNVETAIKKLISEVNISQAKQAIDKIAPTTIGMRRRNKLSEAKPANSEPKMVPIRPQDDPKMIPRRPQDDPKTAPR